ncbi:hypothetical protein PCE1_004219 [Barthelona sp. PCE]
MVNDEPKRSRRRPPRRRRGSSASETVPESENSEISDRSLKSHRSFDSSVSMISGIVDTNTNMHIPTSGSSNIRVLGTNTSSYGGNSKIQFGTAEHVIVEAPISGKFHSKRRKKVSNSFGEDLNDLDYFTFGAISKLETFVQNILFAGILTCIFITCILYLYNDEMNSFTLILLNNHTNIFLMIAIGRCFYNTYSGLDQNYVVKKNYLSLLNLLVFAISLYFSCTISFNYNNNLGEDMSFNYLIRFILVSIGFIVDFINSKMKKTEEQFFNEFLS